MTRRLSVYLLIAVAAGSVPALATEALTDRMYASKAGVGLLVDLGSASAAAETYTIAPVYSSSQVGVSYAQTAPLGQLAQSSTMVNYSSSVSTDRYTISGIDRTGASRTGLIQDFASTTNSSVVTNGYEQPVNSSLSYYALSRSGVPSFTLIQPTGGPISVNLLDAPEPGTWVMMASALVGLGVLRRRQLSK